MNRFKLLFALFTWSVFPVFSQENETDVKELYPSTYSFEKAGEFVTQGKFKEAMWYYINLYPQYRARVAQELRSFKVSHDSIDLIPFIKESFVVYSSNDPAVNVIENGKATVSQELIREKGMWMEAVILRLGDNDKPLSTSFAYFGRGVKKLRANEYEWAITDFNKAIEMEPSSGEYYFQRAEARKHLNEYMEAVADYSKALEYGFKPAQTYLKRGEVNFLALNYGEAIKDFSLAIKADPSMAEAYAGRGRVKQQQKNYKEALVDLDVAVKLKPASAEILMMRALARREAGEKKDACADWKAALALGEKKANEFLKKFCN